MRESTQSWRELLVDLKARGLTIAPELATGDGALGFRKALDAVSPTTRHQRCAVHKTATVLDKMPKSVQPAAESDLRKVWAAPNRATAEAAVAVFADKYGANYEKAAACLVKDRGALLTFYDFPAGHWELGRNAWRAPCAHRTRSKLAARARVRCATNAATRSVCSVLSA